MHVASGWRGWAGFGGGPCILYFHRIPSSSANSLRKTHSHCSTLQEGCTQLTARLSVISLDVPYSWVHGKVTLAQRNYGMFKFVGWRTQVCTRTHWDHSEAPALSDRAPVTCGEWSTLQAINTIIKHKWEHGVERATFAATASETKCWRQSGGQGKEVAVYLQCPVEHVTPSGSRSRSSLHWKRRHSIGNSAKIDEEHENVFAVPL